MASNLSIVQEEESFFPYELCDMTEESDMTECNFLGWNRRKDTADETINKLEESIYITFEEYIFMKETVDLPIDK